MQIIFTIPDEKLQRVIDAIKGLWPVPIDPETKEPLFSDGAWAKERIRRTIRDMVYAYESRIAMEQVVCDDNLVT